MKAYDFASKDAGEYQVMVVAVANNEANNSDPAVRYFANKALDRVAQFQVVNGILVFGAVENAQKYLITIDCGNDKHVHTAFDNGMSTTYYLANCPMQEGGIRITVTAVADGYAASTSEVFVYDLTLDQVGALVYDQATDTFVWDAVTMPVWKSKAGTAPVSAPMIGRPLCPRPRFTYTITIQRMALRRSPRRRELWCATNISRERVT